MNDFQTFIHKSRYARWVEDESRRETWKETVDRYCSFWKTRFPSFPYEEVKTSITNMDVMPSMRALMTAGPALDRDNIAGYNCSYVAVDNPRSFDEILYILMCGTGVGFSVERQFICKLPDIADEFHKTDTTIVVKDSRLGWASAFRELISLLYTGRLCKWDLSLLRPSGARLKTFGGRSSGPEPLNDLFNFTTMLFQRASGRKLNSLECHDLVCKIADVVVVGGVRRSALISLSNLTDDRMRNAKNGQWWVDDGQRALANNSVAYTEKPDIGAFLKEWSTLYESRSGERGIFNRIAAKQKALSTGRRNPDFDFGTNPCGEIILRSNGLCNLSEVVVRPNDSLETLKRKVELATIIGTFQSTLTDFRYVRPVWKKNAEEERLLGVSFTGIMDHPVLSGQSDYYISGTGEAPKALSVFLSELKTHAINVNAHWANLLGINPSVAITTVKPSGTVSQLVDSASGIHPRYSQYYVRTVRNDKKDPLSEFLISQGVPVEQDVTKETNWVFSFPQKAPDNAVLRNDMTAVQQLEHYLMYAKYWCEHNPSITVYVREHEWIDVAAWCYSHFNDLGGVSFLPHTDHVYKQAPYQEIIEEEYKAIMSKFPVISWNNFKEKEDTMINYKELACVAGVCEF